MSSFVGDGVQSERQKTFTRSVLGGHGDDMVPLPPIPARLREFPLPDLLPADKIDAIVTRTRKAAPNS